MVIDIQVQGESVYKGHTQKWQSTERIQDKWDAILAVDLRNLCKIFRQRNLDCIKER